MASNRGLNVGTRRFRPLLTRMIALFTIACTLAPIRASAAAAAPPSIADCLKQFKRACLTPAEVRAYYGVDVLARDGITGKGRTIAIIDSFGSPTLQADLHAFDSAFGLPDPSLTVLSPLGDIPETASGWPVETTLDVEWAHAIAPDARIVVLRSPIDETEGVQGLPQFLALEQYALSHHLADVLSQSWGATEDTLLDAPGQKLISQFHAFYSKAVAAGLTIVAGSGDQGAAGVDLTLKRVFPWPAVGFPASDPLVLAVGGTSLDVAAGGQLAHEVGWPLSGGGVSRQFAEPAYQRGLPKSVQQMLGGHRGLPDIAYDAAPGSSVLVYVHGAWRPVAGTSAAAPQWAGLVALADDLAGHDLGSINPALYQLACSTRYAADFRDITLGQSLGPSAGGTALGGVGFRAGPGWDAVTGLGSPRAATLVADLAHFSSERALLNKPEIGACGVP
jgi:subtilase family serine protease